MASRLIIPVLFVASLFTSDRDVPQAFSEIHALAPDRLSGRLVSGVSLEVDGGSFQFSQGIIAPIRLGGRVVGLAFVGEGTFRYVPEGKVEWEQLERRMDVRSIDRGIDRLALFFTDSTWARIEPQLGVSQQASDKMDDVVKDALKRLVNEDDSWYDVGFLTAMLNPERPPFFHAHVDTDDGRDLFYRFDTGEYEAVSFGEKARLTNTRYDVISQYVPDRLKEGRNPLTDDYTPIQILAYEMEVEVNKNFDFKAEADLTVFIDAEPGSWVPLSLFSELEITSVKWGEEFLPIHRGDKSSSQLWVQMLPSMRPGTGGIMHFEYAGKLLRKQREMYVNRSPTGWYPRSGQSDATFDVTFRIHKDFKIMAGGEQVSSEVYGDWAVSHWVVSEPAVHNSFNVGRFDEEIFEDPRVPPTTLHYSEAFHRDVLEGFRRQSDMGRTVGTDVVNSLFFFDKTFGSLNVPEFNATEIIAGHGQAFPGMIQLSFFTFQFMDEDGFGEIFRAHEVAHQWWGLGVRPATYHDTWLSEGLAEFSGLWYMQKSLMDPPKYFDRLKDTRRLIFKRKGDAGPVWLGPRLRTSRTTDDYQIIVYEKGAWVIHMLRNLMMDFDTNDETPFNNMLKEFFETYRGQSVTTEQFQATVERHIGADMGWFFDQWVYGTELPEYRWAKQGKTTPEGYEVTIAVEQKGVSDDFKMVVPIRISFGNEGFAHVKVLVEGPYTEVVLPLLPREPDDIIFNDFESVLAEVDETRWGRLNRPGDR